MTSFIPLKENEKPSSTLRFLIVFALTMLGVGFFSICTLRCCRMHYALFYRLPKIRIPSDMPAPSDMEFCEVYGRLTSWSASGEAVADFLSPLEAAPCCWYRLSVLEPETRVSKMSRLLAEAFSASEPQVREHGRILYEREEGSSNLAIQVGSRKEGDMVEDVEVRIGDDLCDTIVDVAATVRRLGMEARDDPCLWEALKPWYMTPSDIPPTVIVLEQRLVKGQEVKGRGELCHRRCAQSGKFWKLQQF
eukprot:CAMPEP_0169131984 /NCGR_PEP_ID=MMETSP1015-20121227/38548_1 /TAXON_ID=342587 /ORGANISM="Karlodinium micrum, Strain CCMP2283" /LENGTH=248 /DNA_ID=CAMNT_0009196301 /DNA_START=204 /DNA_END=947 /DNA_ORIENTATION=+